MGKCALCPTQIPDGTTFCGDHQYTPDPGTKIQKDSPNDTWGVPDLDPPGTGGSPAGPTSEPPDGIGGDEGSGWGPGGGGSSGWGGPI